LFGFIGTRCDGPGLIQDILPLLPKLICGQGYQFYLMIMLVESLFDGSRV
jgi:hypothetical protein